MLSLRNGGAVLDLLPEIGGAVGRFAAGGGDILRPATPGATDGLQTACFPLVPFVNRIACGRFEFRGEVVQLPRNFGDHPHVLHGQGWQSPWQVAAHSAAAATLAFDHPAGDWPWAYEALQVFTLMPRALRIELTLANRAARPMPYSLGFHPYFERTPLTVLRADVAGVWLSDDTAIPTGRAGPAHFLDLAKGAPLAAAPFVDHAHFGWQHRLRIDQPDRGRALEVRSELDFLHLFVPTGADYFCAEPNSAMPDALNRAAQSDSGLRVLHAGETVSATMTVALVV
ncbi:MAG: aldose 1-epimerase [Rhizomicrobium sp.]